MGLWNFSALSSGTVFWNGEFLVQDIISVKIGFSD